MGDISTPLASLNCKLEQGVDTLKSFIYLTNEYGVPSVSYIDDFISNFGHDIVTGQFRYSNMDGFWDTVKKDCEKNKVQYKEVYGSLFYELVPKYLQVVTKGWSEEEKKDLISSEKDKLDLLKDFISNFDKYISEGLDMQEVYLENTPELIKKDENGDEYIDVHIEKHGKFARARLYRTSRMVLLAGSCVFDSNANGTSVGNRQAQRKIYCKDGVVTEDMKFTSPSGAGSFVLLHSINGWEHWLNSNGQMIDYYRTRVNNSLVVQAVPEVKTEPIKVVQNKISVEPVKQVEKPEIAATTEELQNLLLDDGCITCEYGTLTPVYINNTPYLVRIDDKGRKYVNLHTKIRGQITRARLYENGWIMLLQNNFIREPFGSALLYSYGIRLQEMYKKYTSDGRLKCNIMFKSNAFASSLVTGTSDNGWNIWLNDNNDSIRVYREPLKNPISTYKNPVTSSKIPRYRLKAQYSSNGSQSLLGRELRLDGKFFGLIIGDTQAKIDGKAYDLSIYIYKNKIDISRLRIFVAPFLAAYELAED